MVHTRLTSKHQATIPKEIRKILELKSGDSIVFEVTNDNMIIIRKRTPFDREFADAVSSTLSEWGSSYDDEDYKNL